MKKVKVLSMILLLTMFVTACSKNMSYTFDVSTGDSVTVKLDITDGYSIEQSEGTFSVCDTTGNYVLQGFFVTADMYDAYLAAVEESGGKIIDTATENGCTYTLYQLIMDTHTENNYICWIDGSSTGVVLASVSSLEEVEHAFDLLSFSY